MWGFAIFSHHWILLGFGLLVELNKTRKDITSGSRKSVMDIFSNRWIDKAFTCTVVLLCSHVFPLHGDVIYSMPSLLFLQTAGGLDEAFFKNLDDLVRHYKRKNQGLAMHLRHSVKRKTALLIQPQKRHDPPDSPEAQGKQMPVPEEDHDYESTSYIWSSCLILTASFFYKWHI